MRTIYKISPASAWREAERAGVYRGSADDARDGYIHFSTASQLAETVRKHYFGQTGLFLIASTPIRWGKPCAGKSRATTSCFRISMASSTSARSLPCSSCARVPMAVTSSRS